MHAEPSKINCGLIVMATGQYCSVPAILVWLTGNSSGHYKRATVSGLQLYDGDAVIYYCL